MQRIRIRYAKRGPLRFTSHRDFARAFERALRRAGVPIAYSQGFTPHPKISYASAAPTGVASEAEYLEIGLQAAVDPEELRAALDAALSPGLDVLEAVESPPAAAAWPTGSTRRAGASSCPRSTRPTLRAGGRRLPRRRRGAGRAADQAGPAHLRRPRGGDRRSMSATPTPDDLPGSPAVPCAILDLVVRQVTPSVRPDDVLSGLRVVADLEPPVPPRATRLAQGTLTAQGEIVDPLDADRDGAAIVER